MASHWTQKYYARQPAPANRNAAARRGHRQRISRACTSLDGHRQEYTHLHSIRCSRRYKRRCQTSSTLNSRRLQYPHGTCKRASHRARHFLRPLQAHHLKRRLLHCLRRLRLRSRPPPPRHPTTLQTRHRDPRRQHRTEPCKSVFAVPDKSSQRRPQIHRLPRPSMGAPTQVRRLQPADPRRESHTADQMRPLARGMLVWLADCNWPPYSGCIKQLARFPEVAIDPIRDIVAEHRDDPEWLLHLVQFVEKNVPIGTLWERLEPELELLASSEVEDEENRDLAEACQDLLRMLKKWRKEQLNWSRRGIRGKDQFSIRTVIAACRYNTPQVERLYWPSPQMETEHWPGLYVTRQHASRRFLSWRYHTEGEAATVYSTAPRVGCKQMCNYVREFSCRFHLQVKAPQGPSSSSTAPDTDLRHRQDPENDRHRGPLLLPGISL